MAIITLGQHLRILRKEKKMSQWDVAQKIGIDRSVYSRLELGDINVSVLRLTQLAKVLGVSVDHILSPRQRAKDREYQEARPPRQKKTA